MPNDADLERMLDEALHSYVAEEPGAHLEGRILATVWSDARERRQAARSRWMRWSFAGAAAVLLVGLAVFILHSRQRAAQVVQTARQSGPSAQGFEIRNQEPVLPSPVRSKPAGRIRSRPAEPEATNLPAAEELPKLNVFPTPEPPTAEERALVTFAAQARKVEKPALITTEKLEVEPLRIAAIHVEPLPSHDGKD